MDTSCRLLNMTNNLVNLDVDWFQKGDIIMSIDYSGKPSGMAILIKDKAALEKGGYSYDCESYWKFRIGEKFIKVGSLTPVNVCEESIFIDMSQKSHFFGWEKESK